MSEVKLMYKLEWRIHSLSVVGFSPDYVMLCCVLFLKYKILKCNDAIYFKCYIICVWRSICNISQIKYLCILFWVLNVMYLMPENGQHDWNMLHMLKGRIIPDVVDSMYLSIFNMMYHKGTNSTEKILAPLN